MTKRAQPRMVSMVEAALPMRPPRLSAGVLRVLGRLGPDMTASEWSAKLGVSHAEVVHALVWLEVVERRMKDD